MTSYEVNTSSHGFCSSSLSPWWYVLHMKSFDYPVKPTIKERLEVTDWFEKTLKFIPCDVCKNLSQILESIGYNSQVDLANREAFAICVWRLHNKVNERLNKPFFLFSELQKQMEQLRASECNTDCCTINSMREPYCRLTVEFKPKKK